MITAIHIDDELRSIEQMKASVKKVPGLSVKASFTSPREALKWLEKNEVDLIFLDVEMNEKNGLDFAMEQLPHSPEIIFVTAHTSFALKAFEACALDYLVKPVYAEKIIASIERWNIKKNKRTSGLQQPLNEQVNELVNNYLGEAAYPSRVFVSMVGEIRVVKLSEVIYFVASGPYTKISLENGNAVTCSESIKSYAESLTNHPGFVRIHRSYLINKDFISSIQRKVGNACVKMVNGDILPVAQQRRGEIFEQLMK